MRKSRIRTLASDHCSFGRKGDISRYETIKANSIYPYPSSVGDCVTVGGLINGAAAAAIPHRISITVNMLLALRFFLQEMPVYLVHIPPTARMTAEMRSNTAVSISRSAPVVAVYLHIIISEVAAPCFRFRVAAVQVNANVYLFLNKYLLCDHLVEVEK